MATTFYVVPGLPRHLRNTSNDNETALRITKIVCEYKGVPIEKVMKKGRKRPFVYARQLAMWFIKNNTQFTLNDIGTFFMHQDHTTIIHSRKTIKNLSAVHPEVQNDIVNIQFIITYGTDKKESSFPLRQAEG